MMRTFHDIRDDVARLFREQAHQETVNLVTDPLQDTRAIAELYRRPRRP